MRHNENVMKLDNDEFKKFLQFTKDRHQVYINRFINNMPRPWTEDPILNEYKFCNVYRELDRGTLYFVEQIKTEEMEDDASPLLKAIIYRAVNNRDFFEFAKGIPEMYPEYIVEQAKKYMQQKGTFVGNAYMAFACTKKGETKAHSLEQLMNWLCDNFGDWNADVFEKAKSLPEVSEALCRIPFIGEFIAYEIICDLFLIDYIPQFNINDWANVGPGAKPSLDKLCPDHDKDYLEACKIVMAAHNSSDWRHKPLNLRNIEHSLCEWRKYWRIADGERKGRKYNPTTTCAA